MSAAARGVAKRALDSGAARGDWTAAQAGATFAAISQDPAGFVTKLAAARTGSGGP